MKHKKSVLKILSANSECFRVSAGIAPNGKRLCDGGEIEAEKLNLLLMFNQGTNVCFSTKAPLLQNRCYVPFFFGI
jgi:hypothetical protein